MGAKRAGIVAVAIVGLGLFGSSVQGLAQLDGELAASSDRREPPAVRAPHPLVDHARCPPRLPEARRF